MVIRFKIVLLAMFFPLVMMAQDSIKTKVSKSSVSKKAKEVEQTLSKSNPESTADKYVELANELDKKGDYAKAEDYLKRALPIYQKQKSKDKIASTTRSIAQIQEKQNKVDDAIKNYQSASEEAVNVGFSRVNSNDASRLQNKNPRIQADYLDSNIKILEKEGKKEEAAEAYKQKAVVDLKSENKEMAIENYEKAIAVSKDKPEEVLKIKSEISKVYASENNLDKAIEITKNTISEAEKIGSVSQQIEQQQTLADLYFKNENQDDAIVLLEETYNLALKNGRTFDAKKAMLALSDYYRKKGNQSKAIELYDQFLNDFDRMIQADSSLVDAKIFQVTEEKIKQLEKERALKDELITKKNKFNYVLIGSVILMLILLGWIAKALFSIKTKNKKIALQSLRREMNPHFIFNSLNSVNQFIAQNNELEANKYLTSYSNLMRNMMETSNKDFITLANELEQIKKYLDLEHLRFQDKFEYEIVVDEKLDADAILVPNMLIQPHLENAIWHGLRYRETKGKLKVTFAEDNQLIKVLIADDGIGVEKSRELKTQNQKVHESRGLNNVEERINLLNDLYHQQISYAISSGAEGNGTLVTLYFSKTTKVV
ncbi:MAG: tetratricopeptide repeat-containing sensor histidine kinase [Flavobacterium sp.]|jgi:tetratricopeptide (TPR) repeat protein|uniref:tetratricopeptide repeat-containing sensor histidine kinase n=1 Tax=Flavobacterium sp. TaxID=239 RepID=UPI003BA654E5